MGPEERWDAIRAYVAERLGKEIKPLPHGGQAEIARELGCSGAHLSNVIHRKIQPGEIFCRKAAHRWGMSYAELERVACGDPDPRPVLSDEHATILVQKLDRLNRALEQKEAADAAGETPKADEDDPPEEPPALPTKASRRRPA